MLTVRRPLCITIIVYVYNIYIYIYENTIERVTTMLARLTLPWREKSTGSHTNSVDQTVWFCFFLQKRDFSRRNYLLKQSRLLQTHGLLGGLWLRLSHPQARSHWSVFQSVILVMLWLMLQWLMLVHWRKLVSWRACILWIPIGAMQSPRVNCWKNQSAPNQSWSIPLKGLSSILKTFSTQKMLLV